MKNLPLKAPLGCDTFAAYPPSTPKNLVIFGKNSDRPQGEKQSVMKYPAKSYGKGTKLKCTYIEIPQVEATYATIISQIDWMWGCEHGFNECGVCIGNEAVWTKVPEESESALLGMDLVRLGLERGKTSREAMAVITNLLEEFGQGGACAEGDPSFTYHNSFLIADFKEAWILETAGRHWVAKRHTSGGINISNGLTIREDFDIASNGIKEYASRLGLWKKGSDVFDFAAVFSEGGVKDLSSSCSRQSCGTNMLREYEKSGKFLKDDMIGILRDHESGICMHGGFETTASAVSELFMDGTAAHWMTRKPNPCFSEFIREDFIEEKEEQTEH